MLLNIVELYDTHKSDIPGNIVTWALLGNQLSWHWHIL